mmetsp:Transcript_28567/g.77054  ORF Transcript_28567/g.77054 Transcript_28567/m.77054 type:complete len:202 (-) Transcript_28567:1868-2473(-)
MDGIGTNPRIHCLPTLSSSVSIGTLLIIVHGLGPSVLAIISSASTCVFGHIQPAPAAPEPAAQRVVAALVFAGHTGHHSPQCLLKMTSMHAWLVSTTAALAARNERRAACPGCGTHGLFEGKHACLAHKCRHVCTAEAAAPGTHANGLDVHAWGQGSVPHQGLKNCSTPIGGWEWHVQNFVQPPWPQQSRVNHVWPVCGSY